MQESIASNAEVNGSVELSNLERIASKYKDIIHQLTSENKDLKKQKEKNESALKKLSDGHSRTQSKIKYIDIQESVEYYLLIFFTIIMKFCYV